MPPKRGSSPKKGKGKSKSLPKPRPADQAMEQTADSDSDRGSVASVASEASQGSLTRRKKMADEYDFTLEAKERICHWYEDRPMFYDIAHDVNKKLQETELRKLAMELNCQPKDISRHFRNMRTDHHKLKANKKPSGSGAQQTEPQMTPLQRLKVEGYAFLDAFYRPRGATKSQTCGRVSAPAPRQNDECSEGEGDADPPSQPGTSPGQPTTKKIRRSPGSSGMQEVILRLLEDSQKSQKAAEEKVQEFEHSRLERAAWAEWLVSAQNEIPADQYRNYQADSFQLAMRYINSWHMGPMWTGGPQQPTASAQAAFQPQMLPPTQPPHDTFLPPSHRQQQQQYPFMITSYPARPMSAPPAQFDWPSPSSLIHQAFTQSFPGGAPFTQSSPSGVPFTQSSPSGVPFTQSSGTNSSRQSSESLSALLGDTTLILGSKELEAGHQDFAEHSDTDGTERPADD